VKVVIAMDSFKGSLTSWEAGHAVQRGIEKAYRYQSRDLPQIRVLPLADGGEGTVTALIQGMGGVYRTVKVRALSQPRWKPYTVSFPDRKIRRLLL